MTNKKLYGKPNRLADVLALIQVLAFDEHAHRSNNGLDEELQGPPKSAETKKWMEVAIEHPEFFRVNLEKYNNEEDPKKPDDRNVISLIARHVKLENNVRKFDTVSPDLTKKFIETAILLYDKEKEKADRWKSFLPMLLSLLVAIMSVASSFYLQHESNSNQTTLKHYEVELKPKQESYANYMRAVAQSFYAAQANNSEKLVLSLDQAENYFYVFEPFLSTYDRGRIWDQYQQFSGLCYTVIQSDTVRNNNSKANDSFLWYKNFFRTNLYKALFSIDNKQVKDRKEN
jgi:hypothetical protein